ncbi:hypothetical protein HDU91_002060, partial [Kappamyces sp. JEL0680]
MNYERQELKTVEQKIDELLKREKLLSEKEAKVGLSEKEHRTLEGCKEQLEELGKDLEYWKALMNAATKNGNPESRTIDGADKYFIERATGVEIMERVWNPAIAGDSIAPSQQFRSNFEELSKEFRLCNEAGRRIYLNLFLSDIVARDEFHEVSRPFPELDMAAVDRGMQPSRNPDNAVAFGKGGDIFGRTIPVESHFVTVEANRRNVYDDMVLAIAEASTLYKTRKNSRKQRCSVWGVVSNARLWQFIHVDEDGLLWRTNEMLLDIPCYEEEN